MTAIASTSTAWYVHGGVRRDWGQGSQSKHRYVGSLGHQSEGETGLIYMRARYMDPETGRFTSEDPGANGGDWFVYCDDDPINRCDNDGMRIVDIALSHIRELWRLGIATSVVFRTEAARRLAYWEQQGYGKTSVYLDAKTDYEWVLSEGDSEPTDYSLGVQVAGRALGELAMHELEIYMELELDAPL